ncbi:fused MFS/spermidine synthase [Kineosporia sp. J2-2]|uniref:Fused MFS/spermidine synthase n=1 Tax=Kineosporia corallincola TaxID=2835133 RepID=A0ABS5TII1_9ACTN|nr:fused MFS/spermidine synthase [Kineosporia corallincola]MBT0770898.1 fused MFS/spermidine synthase [Kineosporia corallincola]
MGSKDSKDSGNRHAVRRLDARARRQVAQGTAEIVPDPDRPGAYTLLVEGTAQSHVDLADPSRLEFEYMRWLGFLIDLAAEPGRPVNVLHLGGGAWTLPRYVAHTRPGSRQRVVEIDEPLIEFVREHLPLPRNAGVRVRAGDAREVLTGLTDDSVDLIIVDVFSGARIPAHLTSAEFAAQAARVLRPGGLYTANLADGPGLHFARAQVATAATVFGETAIVAQPPVLRGRRFGNLVLVAGNGPLPLRVLARRTASDVFAARVLAGSDLEKFVAGAQPVADAGAERSPEPPTSLFNG